MADFATVLPMSPTTMLPITTERLIIRMMREQDVGRFVEYRNDPAIGRFQAWDLPYSEASAQRVVDDQAEVDGPTDGRWVQLAVEFTATGELLGDVAVQLREGGVHATLGYSFAAEHQGKGYATEAACAVVDALCAAGVHRFVATLDPENVPSMRVLEALGFTFESLARNAALIRGEWLDDLCYSLLAQDRVAWKERPRWQAAEIELVEITPDDAYLWGRLRTHHSQERFVSPMAVSFRDALFPQMHNGGFMVPWMRGILADGERVGFLMLGMVTEHHPEPYMWRLLIDRTQQRRGLGTQVLQLLVAQVREWGHPTVTTSWSQGPGCPEPFYLSHGFIPTGEMDDDEIIGRLIL